MHMVTLLKRFSYACLFMMLAIAICGTAKADFPKVTGFAHTGKYHPQLIRVKNDITVIAMDGNYDRDLPDGTPNVEPRTEVAKAFLRSHADNYDFIVVFSNFEYETKDALAFHIGAQNKVSGLGKDLFDDTAEFGSKGKLQGYIDMAAMSRYNLNPYSSGFDLVLQVFAHEFLHQWGSYAKVRGADGTLSDVLIGKDGAHWSFLLDSGASVEYGNQWQDNGNGTFTSVGSRQFYSPLDLYLMGMMKKEEVPPFFVIDSPAIDKKRLPENGVTVSGARRNFTIDDVIAAEGPRSPDADHAQKEFRLGFVLLTRPGDTVTDEQLAGLNAVRNAVATRLSVLTGGRALAQSYLEPKVDVVAPAAPHDAGAPRNAASANDGLAWLRNKQGTDGAWRDNPFTGMRDTAVALDTVLDNDGAKSDPATRALNWMRGQSGSNTDYQARAIRAMSRSNVDASAAASALLVNQNPDGGWGIAAGYQSNPLDTALALQALQPFEDSLSQGKLALAAAYLAARQNPDGGWGNLSGGVSRTSVSTTVMQALYNRAQGGDLLAKAKVFLAGRQNPDGGFGDSPSTVHDTANVMLALLAMNGMDAIRTADAASYISSSQQLDGSWDGSAYSTALAVRLLKSAGMFNWAVVGAQAVPKAPIDGQSVVLSFKVSNTGSAPAPAGIARFYDGDPATGGTPIGNDIAIPALAMGGSIELQQIWNTFNKVGAHKLVVVVDPSGTVTETSKSDNRATISLTVVAAPPGVELSVQASDINVTPAKPTKLPTVLAVSARVSNVGQTDAQNVRVVLMQGQGAAARIIAEKQVNLLARTQQVVNFSATISQAGAYDYSVVIDPDNSVTEQDKSNNSAAAHVETSAALDLEVQQTDLSILHNPVYLGSDVNFKIKLHNVGTQDSPPFKLRYTISDATNSVEAGVRTLQLASGVNAEEDLSWRSSMSGNLALKVEIDPDGVLSESDRSNNTAVLPFQVIAANGPNLAVSYKDLLVQPAPILEGGPVQLSQLVRNTGTAAANNIEVAFFDGDPAAGRMIGSVQTIAALAPGQSATVGVQWASFPDASEHLVFAVADPSSKQVEITRDDNSAFVTVSGISLPDLAVSAGDMLMTPATPHPGDAIDLAVKVVNEGKQPAKDVVVRLYNGDPASGGTAIGADQRIAMLAGGDNQTVHFALPGGAGSGNLSFVVVVDPEQRIVEKTRDNNIARRDTIVQNGDLFISERFFSPNGDGVKDTTTFSFRLKQKTDVSVQVLTQGGKQVRQFGGSALSNIDSGSVTWDGKDDRGALVADGDYRLRIVAKDGSVLGETSAYLDNNRSPVLAAIDTEFEYRRNLSCEMPALQTRGDETSTHGPAQFTADEDHVFMSASPNRDGSIPANFWHALGDGSDLKPILTAAMAKDGSWSDFAVAANGTLFAALKFNYTNAGEHDQLWIMKPDGSEAHVLRDLGSMGSDPRELQMSDDGRYVMMNLQGKRLRIPVDGSAETFLGDVPPYDYYAHKFEAWSPDGQWLARIAKSEVGADENHLQNFIHVEVLDGQGRTVFSGDTFKGGGNSSWQLATGGISWSSDSRRFGFGHSYFPQACTSAPNGFAADFDPCDQQHVLELVDLDKLSLAPVEASRVRADGNEGEVRATASYIFSPGEQKILRSGGNCVKTGDEQQTCLSEIDLETGKVRPLFTKHAAGVDGVNGFLPSGRKLLFTSNQDGLNAGSQCYDSGTDLFSVSSLLNLTADLRAMRSAHAGVMLSGTATDLNFTRFRLEYANAATPTDWNPIQPASTIAVVDSQITTWVPPAYGRYLVRLVVEDAAGNVRESVRDVAWDDKPSITNVYKDNEFVSPNGDQVQDDFVLHYRVMEPVHLLFQVLDKDKNVVRSIARDHSTIGFDAAFQWDGRNEAGVDLPDGQYRVRLQDYEFFVTLDRQAPMAEITLDSAYAETFTGSKQIKVAPVLNYRSEDANYLSLVLDKAAGESPNAWLWLGASPLIGSTDRVELFGQDDSPAERMAKVANFQFRLRVKDKAGNETTAYGTAPEEVFAIFYSNHQHLAAPRQNAWDFNYPVKYIPLDFPMDREAEDTLEGHPIAWLHRYERRAPLRMSVVESVRKPLAAVLVQYRALDECYTCWTEAAVSTFGTMVGKDPAVFVASTAPSEGSFEMLWDTSSLARSKKYVFRLKLRDIDGGEVTSKTDYGIDQAGEYELKIETIDGDRTKAVGFEVHAELREPIARLELRMQSGSDPRYTLARTIHSDDTPSARYTMHLFGDVLEPLDLRLCASYSFTLRATLVSGEIVESPPELMPAACLAVNWIVSPQAPDACNAQPSGKSTVLLIPHSLSQRRLVQMQFGLRLADGTESILNNWNDVESGREYTFDMDTAALPAGEHRYFARLIDEDGESKDEAVSVTVAHDAPLMRITAPLAGAKLCPAHSSKDEPVLPVDAEMSSSSPMYFGAETSVNSLWMTKCTEEDMRAGNCSEARTLEVAGPQSDETFFKRHNHPGGPAQNGEIGRVMLDPHQKSVSVRLHAYNGAGYNTCTAPITVDYDGEVEAEKMSLDRVLFSPRAAAPQSHVTARLVAGEDLNVTVEALPATRREDGSLKLGDTPVRTIANNILILSGEAKFEWDGRNDGAQIVEDGLYAVRVTYVDGCQNKRVEFVVVEVDATPPLLNIAAPQGNAKLGLAAAVTGAVYDTHLVSYKLEFALASAPDTWIPLAVGTSITPIGKPDQLLANWNTFGLSGALTLRLSAIDKASNVSTLDVPLQMGRQGKLVSSLFATPQVFSPNGDGRQDRVGLRWTLLDQVKATVTIVSEQVPDKVLATLMKDADSEAGTMSTAWDGKSTEGAIQPDGRYVARLVVVAQDGSGEKQEETVPFVLDNTAPQLTFINPRGDFATGRGSVTLDVVDTNLDSYEVYLSTAPANDGSWQQLAKGTTGAMGLVVKALEGMAEGKYVLKAVASDQGGNSIELLKPFTLDNTLPKPTLSAPANGAYLSGRNGPAAVRGKIDELNPATFSLRASRVDTGDASELAAGNGSPASELLANWDVAKVADGSYVLALHAQDKAELTGDANITVVVDNTPPLAKLTAPANGGYVRAATDIVGVASDANLQDYRIDIAQGSKAAAQRWSPLGSGTASVDGGKLTAWQGLPQDGVHTLRLTVTDKAGNRAETMAEVIVDTTPPAAPQPVRANVENSRDVRATWNANTESDLAGYNIYRDGKRLNQGLLKDTSYLDTNLDVGLYGYIVKAVDKAGWESEPSDRAPATIINSGPTAIIFGPSAGAKVGASVEVKGTATAGNTFKEYRLFMGQGAAPADWTLVHRSPVPTVADILGGLNTMGVAENATITLKLEAEDLSGQVATATVTVLVDNVPPIAPTQLTGAVNGADASLSWNASPSTDVAGYLLWRNGRLANAQGPVIGSLKPYLITQTSFNDLKLPNGDYKYMVQAMDQAGNLSLESNTVLLSVRVPPHAVITAPQNNVRVGDRASLRAVSADSDVASVEFQYAPAAGGDWTPVGPAVTQAPFKAQWNNAGLATGDYLLRAVATSKFGMSDPAPATVLVHLGDYAAPVLSAKVNGDTVNLSWPSVPAGASGLVLVRSSANNKPTNDRILQLAPSALDYEDDTVPAGAYNYAIHATYDDRIDGAPSDDAAVTVYAPAFRQPYTPTADSEFSLKASAPGAGQMSVVRYISGVADISQSFDTAADGTMTPPVLPLELGENRFELTHTDSQGNVSMVSRFRVVRGTPPAMPSGLTLDRDGNNRVYAQWQANQETDVIGYRVVYAGNADRSAAELRRCDRSSMPGNVWPLCPLNGRAGSTWTPDPARGLDDAWFVAQGNDQTNIDKITINWLPGKVAADYDVEAWSGMEWVPLVSMRDNTMSTVETSLPQPYLTDRLRVKLLPTGQATPTLAAVAAWGPDLVPNTSAGFDAVDRAAIVVSAQNALGLFGPAATQTPGTATPPPLSAVTLSGSVNGSLAHLDWVNGPGPVPGRYLVRIDGQNQDEVYDLSYERALKNGTYRCTVLAMGPQGTLSPESNSVTLTINVPGPDVPANLVAHAQRSGIALSWNSPAPEVQTFRVLRSLQPGGPFAAIAEYVNGLNFLDSKALLGTRYYYVVAALDANGNVGGNSNVAGAALAEPDQLAPPVLLAPASTSQPATLEVGHADIIASATPGTSVTLTRGGLTMGKADAGMDYLAIRQSLPDVRRLLGASANGRAIAYTTTRNGVAVRDLLAGVSRVLPTSSSRPALAPDGKSVVYWQRSADGDGNDLRRMMLDDGTTSTLAKSRYNGEFAWSADASALVFNATDSNWQTGTWLLNVASGQSTPLAQNGGDARNIALSMDGQYFAFMQDGALRVLKLSDGSQVASVSGDIRSINWSMDGKLLYTQTPDSQIGEVKEMTLPGGEVNTLLVAPGPYTLSGILSVGNDGAFVAYVDGKSDLYSHAGERIASTSTQASPDREMWRTKAGQLYVATYQDGSYLRIDPPGLAVFKGVQLKDGDNAFSAYASDAASKRSTDALPAHVIYNTAALPDLAAGENDIVVLPAAPLAGESTRVTATVRNTGNADAINVGVVLTVRDAQGMLTTLAERILPSLAAGASAPVVVDWKPAAAGVYTFVLTLDAADTVAERNEFNNVGVRTVRVAEFALPKVLVSTDASSYGSNAPVAGAILLTNAGAAVSGKLVLRVEDAQGYLVEALPEQALAQLATGQELSLRTGWNTGSYLAGNYRLVGDLVAANGTVVQSGTAAFAIVANRQASATLAVDRSQYTAGQDVRLGGTVLLANANAQLDNVSAELQVLAADGSVVWSSIQPIGTLLPGASSDVAAVWNVGGAAAGDYKARLLARSGDSQLASAETGFTVTVASATASVTGDLKLSSLAVANGDHLSARYTLNNAGNGVLAGLPLTVTVSRADNGAVLASVPAQADIAARGQATGEAGFDVAGWPLTTLQVTLQATLDGKPVALQRSSLRVIDRLAPTLAWTTPLAGSIVGGADAAAVAQAADRESQLASVEVAIDGGAWRGMAPRDLVNGLFASALQGLSDGVHSFRARATDSFGNVSPEAVLSLVVDNTAPVISVNGVEEGGRYPGNVTPVIAATDAHLANVTTTLDNAIFASGTTVSALGQHTLQVTARDVVGNSSVRSVSFTLASAAPELSGTLQANPAQAEVGASVALSGTVHNGATPAPGTRVDLVVTNSATGALVFQSTDNIDLAANASWTLDRGWTVVGPAGTGYLATLAGTAGGRRTVLATAGFAAVEALPVLDVQQSAGSVGRLLVLSMCKRSMYANLGRCGAAPITGDAATTLLVCDTNRAKTIDQYLDGLGVPHKTVTKEADFAKELRSGAYSSYWISGGATKLRQPLTSELRNGLYLGEALVADGLHDLRQADRALDGLLGMQYSGRFAANAVPKLSLQGPVFGGGVLPVLGDAYTLQGRAPTLAEGLFLRDAGQSASIAWNDDSCGSAAPTAGPDVQMCPAPGSTSGADAGVLSGGYAQGRTLLFGFDFEASCTAQGADPAWQAVARNSFDWLNQPMAEPSGIVVAGDTVVRRTSLHNSGVGSSVTVTAQLPAGAKLLDSKPAGQLTSGANGDVVSWPLTLDGGADAQLELRLQAPMAAGSYQLHYSVSAVSGGNTKVLSSQDVGLQVLDLDAAAQAAADAVGQLDVSNARSDAAGWLARARASAAAGAYERALREAATAQARLEQLGSNATAAQQALARLVRAIERRM